MDLNSLNQKEISDFCLNSIEENSSIELHSTGYILKFDLEYPSNYPLAPEKLEISQTMLSSYCCNIANACEIKIGGS